MTTVDAMREVAAKLQARFDAGKTRVDAYDLAETLLAIADAVDPPSGAVTCPDCGSSVRTYEDDESATCECGLDYLIA